MIKYVQFADESRTQIKGEFGNSQNPDVYQNQGEVKENDPRWIDFCARQTAVAGEASPIEKLKAFLSENPDVAAILK